MVFRCRLLGPSDSSILGGSIVGVLVHIGNASEMDQIGHHVMMKRRSQRGDGDGEGPTDGAKCSAVSIQRAPVPSVPLLACPVGH